MLWPTLASVTVASSVDYDSCPLAPMGPRSCWPCVSGRYSCHQQQTMGNRLRLGRDEVAATSQPMRYSIVSRPGSGRWAPVLFVNKSALVFWDWLSSTGFPVYWNAQQCMVPCAYVSTIHSVIRREKWLQEHSTPAPAGMVHFFLAERGWSVLNGAFDVNIQISRSAIRD